METNDRGNVLRDEQEKGSAKRGNQQQPDKHQQSKI